MRRWYEKEFSGSSSSYGNRASQPVPRVPVKFRSRAPESIPRFVDLLLVPDALGARTQLRHEQANLLSLVQMLAQMAGLTLNPKP